MRGLPDLMHTRGGKGLEFVDQLIGLTEGVDILRVEHMTLTLEAERAVLAVSVWPAEIHQFTHLDEKVFEFSSEDARRVATLVNQLVPLPPSGMVRVEFLFNPNAVIRYTVIFDAFTDDPMVDVVRKALDGVKLTERIL